MQISSLCYCRLRRSPVFCTMAPLETKELALAALGSFVAWGYATHWFPPLRLAGYAFVAGAVLAVLSLAALVLLTSRGAQYRTHTTSSRRPHGVAFVAPAAWPAELAALESRQSYDPDPIAPDTPKVSEAVEEVLGYIVRDFVQSWYGSISKNPVFTNEVDRAIRAALGNIRDRILQVDLAEVLTSRLVPILTAHFRGFYDAERAVRGKKLNRSVTETDELDLAIAAKYNDGKLHPAAALSHMDAKTTQQEYLRDVVAKLLPKVLPENMSRSRAVTTLVREIVACAVLGSVMQILSDPDTWNQVMENYGRSMLQDRSTVRKLRAALDQHASPAPRTSKPVAFPRLSPGDSERRFEKFVRSVRKVSNLSDARRFRSEVASQLKRESQKEGQDPVHLRRLEMGKRLLDQRVQQLAAAGGDRRAAQVPMPSQAPPRASRLENASLEELLRDSSGLSYFMEYMDRQRLLPLVQFWLVVDGFRNPLEDDGPEDEQLPLVLPPWNNSDRLDLAQINQAYLSMPVLKVPPSSRKLVQEFLDAGSKAIPAQYYRARRAILRAQTAVLDEMRINHFQNFKKSDLFYKCLAAEEAASRIAAPYTPAPAGQTLTAAPTPTSPALNRASQSFTTARPNHATRLANRLNPVPNRRAGSTSDLRSLTVNGSGLDPLTSSRRSLDEGNSSPLFGDEEDWDNEALADSVQSLDQEPMTAPPPDTRVVKAVEDALSTIMEDSQPPTAEDLRASLFSGEDSSSGIFSPETESLRGSARGSLEISRPGQPAKEVEKPSLSSLGLVSAASRIGVFEDNDLFADEDKHLSDEREDLDGGGEDDEIDEVHEAAPGDLGLAEAITALSNDIDKLVAQEAIVESLQRKAELTNNTAELRILRKSKASLQREIRRKELQRQQYVIQESDNSLYGRSTIKITGIQVGRDDDGKEYALYAIEVSRDAGEKMPAATWVVTRRYSEFLELHQKLRSRYPSVRNLDFPRRRMVMKLQSEFLQKRRDALEKYMRELLLLPEACRSRDLRAFLSQTGVSGAGAAGRDLVDREDKKDMMTRLYDSVADGMEDILGSIPVLDQLSLAGQNLIAAATSQLNNTVPLGGGSGGVVGADEGGMSAAEAEAELNAFENKELEPFVKPICDVFLEVFELNRGNNWLRGRAVVVVLHQLLGGTIERKLRDNVRLLVQQDAVLKYVGLVRESMWPGGCSATQRPAKAPRTPAQKSRTRTEASLMLATLVPDLAGSVVGRLNAQAASRRIFATLNNQRLK